MNYYAFIIDDKINGKGQCPCSGDGITCVDITEEVYNNIDHYIWDGTKVVLDPNYEEKQRQKEQEQRKQEILKLLDELDLKSIRAIRSGDEEYIEKYEQEAQALREELRELGE